jgi:hypothetical protein
MTEPAVSVDLPHDLLVRVLAAHVQAEKPKGGNGLVSATHLGAVVGSRAEASVTEVRRKLLAAGLLVQREGERRTRLTGLTDAGRALAARLGIGVKAPRPQPATAKRTCLMCGQRFDSWGVGNRICGRCKGAQEWRMGEAYA